MAHDNLPDDCPTREGEDCPVVEEHKRNHRRSTDRMRASAMRIILALIGVIGTGTGGYMIRDKVLAAPPAPADVVDRQAREDIRLLRTEISGDLKLISQQLNQIVEAQKEAKAERDQLVRRLERGAR